MKYSKLHTKIIKNSKEYESVNATLLQKAGFIHQTMAGVYTFLPLGLRVLQKIEAIVREEMDKIGVEMYMPAISPKEIWEKTGRLQTIDVLMKAVAANETSKRESNNEYVLNCTHEDLVTPIAQLFNTSYKDFPFAYYQIQDKFRNEPRAKSGLLRGREFRMKDLYSFHVSEEDLLDFYHKYAKEAYVRVYQRVGLGEQTVIALASGGDFTDEYSHEFQTRCEAGEDVIFYSKAEDVYYNREVAPSKAPLPENMEEEMKQVEDVYGENIVGMDDLVEFLQVPANRCVKTLIYKADGEVVVVAVRGDYDINEIKLKKVLGCKQLALADEETVQQTTGASLGYAGIINLPDSIRRVFDDSIEPLKNFECGTNKTNYHTINLNWGRDLEMPEQFFDIKLAKEGDLDPKSGEQLETFAAAEVGNIFPLNTKFSEAFDYKYTDENGEQHYVYMGSYGIGTTRLVGVLAEIFNDENGIIWPEAVAPYQVQLVALNLDDEQVAARAEAVYQQLTEAGVEVLFDDRLEASAGEKFANADLIGCPWRVVISKKTGEQLEVKRRSEDETRMVSVDELLAEVNN